MALTYGRTHASRRRAETGDMAMGPGVRSGPSGAVVTGGLAILVGVWAAIAGYIGPYFDFRPVAHDAWVANLQNGLLHLLPGAVAVAAGLVLLATSPARRPVSRATLWVPAVVLLAAGAWLVVGPVAWPTFESGPAFMPVLSASRNLLNVACSSLAPGLVLVMFGGMALKAGSVRRPVEDPMTPAEATPAGPVGEPSPAGRDSMYDAG